VGSWDLLEEADPNGLYGVITELGFKLAVSDGLQLRHYPSLRCNEVFVRAAVEQNGLALEYAGNLMQNNDVIVRAAVEQNGLALKYASAPMQDDISVVLPAVQQQGMALERASLSMRADPTVVRAAIFVQPHDATLRPRRRQLPARRHVARFNQGTLWPGADPLHPALRAATFQFP